MAFPPSTALLQRILILDKAAQKTNTYTTLEGEKFMLAEYVASNIAEHNTLSQFSSHIYLLLWVSCQCSPTTAPLKDISTLLQYANDTLYPQLDFTHDLRLFLIELSLTIQDEIPTEERDQQLQIFKELTQENSYAGDQILFDFKESTRGLAYLSHTLFALPFFLQVHTNSEDLVARSHLARICRKKLLPNIQCTTNDWIHVIQSIQPRLRVNAEDCPAVLQEYIKLFHDPSVCSTFRCLQLFTIYHPDWKQIWTLVGWNCNRFEVLSVHKFLNQFPAPFSQDHVINDFFYLFSKRSE